MLMVSTPDFAGSMKGKRNIDSLKDSIFTEISRKKIDASKIAIDVRTKLDFFNSIEDQYKPLFSDLQYIIYKPIDDFKLAIQSRIDAYTTVDRVIITQEKTEQILVVCNEEQSRENEVESRIVRIKEPVKAPSYNQILIDISEIYKVSVDDVIGWNVIMPFAEIKINEVINESK